MLAECLVGRYGVRVHCPWFYQFLPMRKFKSLAAINTINYIVNKNTIRNKVKTILVKNGFIPVLPKGKQNTFFIKHDCIRNKIHSN